MIGNRQAKQLDELLKTLKYDELAPEEKGEVAIAYSELYSWGGMGYNYSEIAYQLSEKLVKDYPTFWKGYYSMALVLSHRVQKNNLLAIILLTKIDQNLELAIKYGQDQWLPYLLSAIRYIEVPIFPDLEKAEMLIKKAIELNPDHNYSYLMYGKLLEKKQEYCESAKMYKMVLSMKVRPERKKIDEEAQQIARQRLSEVEKKCTKK
jgi:tetratricopeptide (TPR) repeat protein